MVSKCLWVGAAIFLISGVVLGILSLTLVSAENIRWLYGILTAPLVLVISGIFAILASNKQRKNKG